MRTCLTKTLTHHRVPGGEAFVSNENQALLWTLHGYHHVFHYRGGKEHWKEGGLPLETSVN